MKFRKFGKALLLSALSVGIVLSVTSCVRSYSTGYLYVTGTETANSGNNGYIAGFSIDHNTGTLHPINGLNPPIASGGANPVRAVLVSGGRFLYVLNRGVSTNPAGSSICTTQFPCSNSNITQFEVGGNGILTPVETFYTQGINPMRIVVESTGTLLYVLDHDSPDNTQCYRALGAGVTSCGDVTVFSINSTTGRLSTVLNTQAGTSSCTSANCPVLSYFPVPANAIDFTETQGYLLTLAGTPTTGDTIFPYQVSSSNGQLTLAMNGTNKLSNSNNKNGFVDQATALVSGGGYIYVLDNEPIYVNGTLASNSQMIPLTCCTSGAVGYPTSGPVPDDVAQSNPIAMLTEAKSKWFYVANDGYQVSSSVTEQSGIAGFDVNTPYLPTEIPGTPVGFTTGGGPQCIVEDPSGQFIYTANAFSATITGMSLDENVGELRPLSQTSKAADSYSLAGPASWCLIDGRTN